MNCIPKLQYFVIDNKINESIWQTFHVNSKETITSVNSRFLRGSLKTRYQETQNSVFLSYKVIIVKLYILFHTHPCTNMSCLHSYSELPAWIAGNRKIVQIFFVEGM